MSLKRLCISGYKSIESFELTKISSFSVFAGANGAGKSNLFDAIHFTSTVIRIGATDAIRQFGGYGQIHCFKKRGKNAQTFKFHIDINLDNQLWKYELQIKEMESNPTISEKLTLD